MAVQLGFQVGEEVLGDRVVPAHTDLAHGLGDVVLAAPLLEFVGGVLGAPVGMEDHGVPFQEAVVPGHPQGGSAQTGAHVFGHGSSDDRAGKQVDDGGQVEPVRR